jgi:hypothetical protein
MLKQEFICYYLMKEEDSLGQIRLYQGEIFMFNKMFIYIQNFIKYLVIVFNAFLCLNIYIFLLNLKKSFLG